MKRYTDILKALESLRLIKFYIENKHLLLLDAELEKLSLITKRDIETNRLLDNLHNALRQYVALGNGQNVVIHTYEKLLLKIQQMLITSNEGELNI